MFAAYFFACSNPILFCICYALSQILDMFDGMAARRFNQATKFGAMLDMVTDRCSTVGLLMTVSNRIPSLQIFCHIFIWLDIFSHWAHMLASLSAGAGSHKNVRSGPKLLQYYYKTKWFMVLLIIGAEGLPLAIYLSSFHFKEPLSQIINFLILIFAPLFFTKHFINVIQFMNASVSLDHPPKKE
ncbi:CDP-alcohol phosphatidyltransferase family protein [Histomonas meleagridis]|uniref:CDP-alcohol phosphatidyltransferase family protein n=1 Tax=Histomonas meleagridis TaxID=135588 RepID=UPI003559A574|nr:CDP-alcohol phosphatidyltransferase family protein [Histomonas meleagridis]KAH0797848.1 CDP-alcohol phosphatidyltransferase family protein [Histomonas meleagridis]